MTGRITDTRSSSKEKGDAGKPMPPMSLSSYPARDSVAGSRYRDCKAYRARAKPARRYTPNLYQTERRLPKKPPHQYPARDSLRSTPRPRSGRRCTPNRYQTERRLLKKPPYQYPARDSLRAVAIATAKHTEHGRSPRAGTPRTGTNKNGDYHGSRRFIPRQGLEPRTY